MQPHFPRLKYKQATMINYDCRFLCQYQQMEGQSQQETKQQETSILCGIHLFKLVEIKAKQGLLFLL